MSRIEQIHILLSYIVERVASIGSVQTEERLDLPGTTRQVSSPLIYSDRVLVLDRDVLGEILDLGAPPVDEEREAGKMSQRRKDSVRERGRVRGGGKKGRRTFSTLSQGRRQRH